VSSGSFSAPDHEYPSYLELTLTATDSQNLSASTTVRLDPKTVQLTMASSPAGLQLSINGVAQATPFTVTVIQNSNNTISAPTPQDFGGARYAFDHWSDGGLQSHNVTAGSTNTTYTATYLASSADIGIVKDGTPNASTQRITYSLAVTNHGPGTATSVSLTDVIERGQNYVSASTPQGSCAYNAGTGTLSCALGTLAANQTVTVTLVVSVDRWKGWANNSASVTSATPDLDTSNNTTTVRIRTR